jgi:prophage regulatory protein
MAADTETTDQKATHLPINSGFIRQKRLIPGILPVSSATLWRMVKDGRFPKPVKLSAGVTAWRAADVQQWLEQAGGK